MLFFSISNNKTANKSVEFLITHYRLLKQKRSMLFFSISNNNLGEVGGMKKTCHSHEETESHEDWAELNGGKNSQMTSHCSGNVMQSFENLFPVHLSV